jgi:hypothetical protein
MRLRRPRRLRRPVRGEARLRKRPKTAKGIYAPLSGAPPQPPDSRRPKAVAHVMHWCAPGTSHGELMAAKRRGMLAVRPGPGKRKGRFPGPGRVSLPGSYPGVRVREDRAEGQRVGVWSLAGGGDQIQIFRDQPSLHRAQIIRRIITGHSLLLCLPA